MFSCMGRIKGIRIRQARDAGRRLGRRHARRDASARHHHERRPPGGDRLLPAHRRSRGADVRRGEDPRRVLPSRGSSIGDGHPHGSPHRPAAAPHVQGRLPRRGPGRRDGALRGPREPVRHPRHQRRQPVHDDRRSSLRRARRRGPPRADRRRMEDQPDVPGCRAGHLRRGRRWATQRRGDHRHPDDRGRGPGQHLEAPGGRGDEPCPHGGGRRRRARGREAGDRRADRRATPVPRRAAGPAAALRAATGIQPGDMGGGVGVRRSPPPGGAGAGEAGARGQP